MRIVITGGYGFLGRILARELLHTGTFRGAAVTRLTLVDRFVPAEPPLTDPRVDSVQTDLAEGVDRVFTERVDVIFHLAAAVSSECEADLTLGLRANLQATMLLLEAARAQSGTPVVFVFASSIAVFGSDPAFPLPEIVTDDTPPMPQSSYGAQKVTAEVLIADHTRKGLIDGRVARLMTVAIRPGTPNAAASGFVSGIVREPLAGVETTCPVNVDLPMAIASPRATVRGLLTVAEARRGARTGELSGRMPINLPALTVTAGELLEAVRTIAGDAAVALVRMEPNAAIEHIVGSWPARFDSARARQLGLTPDPDVISVIRQYVQDQTGAGR